MTQDAPLDQKALDAAIRAVSSGTFVNTPGGAENVARVAIRAYLDALSRRVPASGELNERLSEILDEDAPNKSVWKTFETQDEWLRDKILPLLRDIRAASPIVAAPEGWRTVPVDDDSREFANSTLPIEMIRAGMDALEKVDEDNRNYVAGETIDWDNGMVAVAVYRAMLSAAPSIPEGVAAPEGWRRAFLAYVEPEDAFTQLAIALCRADGHNPDATISIDGGPMQRHWHYYADEARAMLAAAPSIPEGKAEPQP